MNNLQLEQLLNSLSPGVLDLVIKLRILVIGSNPNLVERIYPSWKTIGFGAGHKMSAQVCYLQAHQSYATLGFNRGTNLPDPKNLLINGGENLRYIQVFKAKDIDTVAILEILKAAWSEANS